MHSLAQKIELARGALYRISETEAETIGRMAFDAEAKGENCGIWHQAALYFGSKCHCAQCDPRRRFV